MAGIDQEMFNKMANVENFNDPQRNALINMLCKLVFGKELNQLNSFGQGFMKQAGFGIMNSFGDVMGLNDSGLNFAILHQAVARSSNFAPMDQNGNYMPGAIQGPGATTLGIAKQLNRFVNGLTETKTNAENTYYTSGLDKVTISQMVGQIIRERGGLQNGDYVQIQGAEPGAEGAEKALKDAMDKGLDKDHPAVKDMARAIAATKVEDEILSWGDNEDKFNEMQKDAKDAKEAAAKARKQFKKGKISREELEQAEKEEEVMTSRAETAKKMKDATDNYKAYDDEVEKLKKRAANGEDVARQLAQAKESRDEQEKVLNKAKEDALQEHKKAVLKEVKVEGKTGEELGAGDVDKDTIRAVREGKMVAGGISKEVTDEIQDALKVQSKNVLELTEIFGTNNFKELQQRARDLNMGSLTSAKNVAEIAQRIRAAKANAERTGRSVAEVFEEQAAIASMFERVTGRKASAATITRFQNQREAAARNVESGSTTLTQAEQEGKILDAEGIIRKEKKELFNAHYLFSQLKDSTDPEAKKVYEESQALYEQLQQETDPAKRRAIEKKIVQLSYKTFGHDMTSSELVAREAEEKDAKWQDEAVGFFKHATATQNDANYYVNNIKNSPILRKQAEALDGKNWQQKAKTDYATFSETYGGDYQAIQRDLDTGKRKRAALDAKLTDENREAVHQKEQELETLQEQLFDAKTPEEKEQIREKINQVNSELQELGGAEYAAERVKIGKDIEAQLTAYRKNLEKSGKFSKEEIDRAVETRRRTITDAGSSNAYRALKGMRMKHTTEQSRAASSMQSREQMANEKNGERDQFEKDIEQQGSRLSKKGFIAEVLRNVVTGGQEINEETALAEYLKSHGNGQGLYIDPNTGEAKIDVDALNENSDGGVLAIKTNATDEEKKAYAQNEKIRKMLGVESEEEALKLLNDPAKLQDRLMHLRDNGKIHAVKMGEGKEQAVVITARKKMDELIRTQQETQEKRSKHTKWYKGMVLDGIKADENGVSSIEIGDQTFTAEEQFNDQIADQVNTIADVKKNIEDIAKNGDKDEKKRAQKILDIAQEKQEAAALKVGDGENNTFEEMQKIFGNDFDRSYEDAVKEGFQGSEDEYNLLRVQWGQKYHALERAHKADGDGLKTTADRLGIKWDGKKISELSAEDQARLAAEWGNSSEKGRQWLKEDYNKFDFLNTEEGIKSHMGADGKVLVKGAGKKGKDEVSIDMNDYGARNRSFLAGGGARSGRNEDDWKQGPGGGGMANGLLNNILKAISSLAGCVAPGKKSLLVTTKD